MSRTQKALVALEQTEGRPWREAVEAYARRGYTWADVAEIIGVNTAALKQWCHSRELKFSWQGQRSPQVRAQNSRATKGCKVGTQPHHRRYTAFGVTDSLPNLVKRFGAPHKVTYETARRRINRGVDPETALTTPPMDKQTKAQLANRSRWTSCPNHPWITPNVRPAPGNPGL